MSQSTGPPTEPPALPTWLEKRISNEIRKSMPDGDLGTSLHGLMNAILHQYFPSERHFMVIPNAKFDVSDDSTSKVTCSSSYLIAKISTNTHDGSDDTILSMVQLWTVRPNISLTEAKERTTVLITKLIERGDRVGPVMKAFFVTMSRVYVYEIDTSAAPEVSITYFRGYMKNSDDTPVGILFPLQNFIHDLHNLAATHWNDPLPHAQVLK